MNDEKTAEWVIERLIRALAAQLGHTPTAPLVPEAVEALSRLPRPQAKTFFGVAGHLVHYEPDTESIESLIHLVSEIQRRETPGDATIVAGDEVRLVGDLPLSLDGYDPDWARQTAFVVRYVGDDGTVDLQPDLDEDYVLVTVPTSAIEPRWRD